MLQLDTAGLSDTGRKRSNNEDAFLVDDEHGLYAVADGMGGHLAGEVASAMVIDSLKAAVANPDIAPPAAASASLTVEAAKLLAWIRDANRRVYQRSQSDAHCRGMGATIAALYCVHNRIITANVGDSPVYLVRGNDIEMISAMHTVAAEQAAAVSEYRELLSGMYRHMLTRAVGIEADITPHILETDCRAGDAFIVCSDGLSNAVATAEMSAIVRRAGAAEACRRLVDLANARGGDDNITVIVVKTLNA